MSKLKYNFKSCDAPWLTSPLTHSLQDSEKNKSDNFLLQKKLLSVTKVCADEKCTQNNKRPFWFSIIILVLLSTKVATLTPCNLNLLQQMNFKWVLLATDLYVMTSFILVMKNYKNNIPQFAWTPVKLSHLFK